MLDLCFRIAKINSMTEMPCSPFTTFWVTSMVHGKGGNTTRVAGGEGFEPSLSEPESDVLPLDDPPTREEA